MASWGHHFVLDVEADGPCPGLFNMISFALVSLTDLDNGFLGEVAPILDHPGVTASREIVGVSLETQKTYAAPETVMRAAAEWVTQTGGGKRAIFWSDNPAFDWQFWNWYCHRYLGDNPAGFSARRIGDLDAGRRDAPLNTLGWKKHRLTPHTHNPLDDARGNAEALQWILTEMGETF